MQVLNNSFGSGGMSLAMNDMQFMSFFQFPKNEIGSLPIKKAARTVGLQPSGVWILGRDLQFNSFGELIPERERQYIWLEEMMADDLSPISMKEVIPIFNLPLVLETCMLNRYICE